MGVVRWRAATTEPESRRLAGDGDDGWDDGGGVRQDRAEERRRDEGSG